MLYLEGETARTHIIPNIYNLMRRGCHLSLARRCWSICIGKQTDTRSDIIHVCGSCGEAGAAGTHFRDHRTHET